MLALLLAWCLVTLGLTYGARTATLLAAPRLYLVAHVPWIAELLGCGWCTSWWTGMIAFAALFPASGLDPGWLAMAPAAGFAGTGLWDLREALSPSAGARTLASTLGKLGGE
ncbi:MAG: hypothetical protein ABID40_02835 [Candidatus Bipolaricaulota bacterium]